MEKSYGEIEKRNSQGKIDDNSKNKNAVVGGHPLPKDEIISDTFQRTVNTHDVQGEIILLLQFKSQYISKKSYQICTKISLNISPIIFLPTVENVVKTQMAQDLGLISRRGVERLMRGDVDPDRLIEEAQHVKNVSAMDLYKK